MKSIRWRLILRGGYRDEKLISVFDHKPEVEPLSLLEKAAVHAIHFSVSLFSTLAGLHFGGKLDIF